MSASVTAVTFFRKLCGYDPSHGGRRVAAEEGLESRSAASSAREDLRDDENRGFWCVKGSFGLIRLDDNTRTQIISAGGEK
jgi:hypothetical protein